MNWKIVLAFLSTPSIIGITQKGMRGALFDYVYTDDPNYGFEVVDTVIQDGYTTYVVELTSQQWFDGKWDGW